MALGGFNVGSVTARLGAVVDPTGFERFQRSLTKARAEAKHGAKADLSTKVDTRGMVRYSRSLREVDHQHHDLIRGSARLNTGISRLFIGGGGFAIGIGAVYGLARAFKSVGTETVTFDRAMRNVNSIAQLSEGRLKGLSTEVLRLAGKTAQAPETLAAGLYTLVSSGFNAKESMKVLAASARAATAGLTDTETSTRAVAAVLNAYRRPANDAAKVSDILFRTVDRGVLSFEDLAQNIGDVLPFATSLKIPVQDVGSAIATLTKEGLDAPVAVTRLKNAMQAFIKPADGMKEAIKKTGAASGEALIKQKGFQGALEAVVATTDGSKEAIAKLFPNIRGLGGALGLTGKNAKGASKDLKEFQDTGGATAKALSQQSQSISFQWNKLKAEFSSISIAIGGAFLQAIKPWLPAFEKTASDISKVFLRKDLNFGEKFSKAFDVAKVDLGPTVRKIETALGRIDFASALDRALNFAIPRLANIGGRLGFVLAKNMVKAFFDAPPLGQLFLGLWIYAKGRRLLGAFGLLGRRSGGAAAEGVLGSLGGGLASGAGGLAARVKALFNRIFRRTSATVAEQTAANIMGNLAGGVAAREGTTRGRVRRSLDRIFRRGGAQAGESGGASAVAGMIGGLTARIPGLGRLGIFSRLGLTWGRVAGLGFAGAMVAAMVPNLTKVIDNVRQRIKGGSSVGDVLRTAQEFLLPGLGRKDETPRRAPAGPPAGPRGPARREAPIRAPRVRTVEIQEPVIKLGGGARQAEAAMNRLQRVLRREFRQAVDIAERGSRRIEHAIAIRPLRGDDPLHLASGIKRSREDAVGAARQIVNRIRAIFDRIRVFRGDDPLDLGRGIKRSREDALGAARKLVRDIANVFDRLSNLIRGSGRETTGGFLRTFRIGADGIRREARDLRGDVVRQFSTMSRQGSHEARDLVRNLRETFNRLPNVVSKPTGDVLRIVAGALRSLGASGVARISATASRIEGRAFGGMLPGYSKTDDRIIAVRGGEAVLRPEDHVPFVSRLLGATKAMGIQPFGSLGEMFQQTGAYAKGGTVTQSVVQKLVPAKVPTLYQDVVQRVKGFASGGIVRLGRQLQREGYEVGENPVFGGVHPVHARGSYHYKGEAIDVNDDDAPGGEARSLDRLYARLNRQRKRLGIVELLWRVPGHFDHLHIAIPGAGGALTATAASAPRVRTRTRGPAGAIRRTVAAGLSRVERAANRRLTRAEASVAEGPEAQVARGAYGKNRLRNLWVRAGGPRNLSNIAGAIALAESGGSPNARNPSGASGLWQILGQVVRGNIFNPLVNARNAVKKWRDAGHRFTPWVQYTTGAYRKFLAKGGFVGRAVEEFGVPGFQRGGTYRPTRAEQRRIIRDTAPPSAKKPSKKKARPKRPKPVHIRPYRGGRARHLIPTGLLSGFNGTIDGALPFLDEDYGIAVDDAGLVDEQFIVDDASGNQAVDWSAVRIRIGELTGLITKANSIQAKLVEARNLALRIINELKAVAQEQLKRVAGVYRQLSSNLAQLTRLRNHLKAEQRKKHPDRAAMRHMASLIAAIEAQNRELGGRAESMPRTPAQADEGSILGRIWSVVSSVSSELDARGDGVASKLVEVQGLTGRGGRLRDTAKDITAYMAELADLQPGGKLVRLTPGTTDSGATDVQNFLAGLADIQRQFGSNFSKLPIMHTGGIVPGQRGQDVHMIAEGGEMVFNKDKNAFELHIKLPEGFGGKTLNLTNNFKEQPPDPHTFARSAKFELEAAI